MTRLEVAERRGGAALNAAAPLVDFGFVSHHPNRSECRFRAYLTDELAS